jgi:CBS domain-containing protein
VGAAFYGHSDVDAPDDATARGRSNAAMITPLLEKAEPLLPSMKVRDAMHRGIVTCPPTAGVREIAAALAESRIHSIVVADPAGEDDARSLWGVVSDVQLMRGLASAIPLTAGNLASRDFVTVSPDDTLEQATRLLAVRGIAHVVVVEDGRPAGMLSALDVATVAALAADA